MNMKFLILNLYQKYLFAIIMSDFGNNIDRAITAPLIRKTGNKSLDHNNDNDSIQEEVKLHRAVSLRIHNKDKLLRKEKKQKVFTDLMVLHNGLYK